MSWTLEEIGPGQVVFVDANIIIYHFTGPSYACRTLLERCEDGEVLGITGAKVVLEVLRPANDAGGSSKRPGMTRKRCPAAQGRSRRNESFG